MEGISFGVSAVAVLYVLHLRRKRRREEAESMEEKQTSTEQASMRCMLACFNDVY